MLGITAVAGNVPLAPDREERAQDPASSPAGAEVQVFSGAIRPMVRELVTAEPVHGKTGLDGPDLPEPTVTLQDQHARRFHHRDADARASRQQ